MTTLLHFSAVHLGADKVEMTCSVIHRKHNWLVDLLRKCPGPKAQVQNLNIDMKKHDVTLDHDGRVVEHSSGSWKVIVPSAQIDCPKNSPSIQAVLQRSLNGAARTAVWLEQKVKQSGDTMHCKTPLAEVLRLGPGQKLDLQMVQLVGQKPNEAFLERQEELQREAKKPRISYVT